MDWIFYLQDTNKISSHYLKIADRFKDYGITLIPIKSRDLINLTRDKGKIHVISVVPGQDEKMAFNARGKRICTLMLKQRKMFLYQLTPFQLMDGIALQRGQEQYYKVDMPVSAKDFVGMVC
jgi:hypothetical protein